MLNKREVRTGEEILVSEKLDCDKEIQIKEWLLIILFLMLSLYLLSTHTVLERKIRGFPQNRRSYCF